MAEGIMREKLKNLRIEAVVDSCGFESFHVGDEPDSRAISVAKRNGIDITKHRARLFRVRDFDEFDHIFVMDSSHFNNVMRNARNAVDRNKVDYFLNVLYPAQNQHVMDPWYHDMAAFEKVFAQLDAASEKFTLQLT